MRLIERVHAFIELEFASAVTLRDVAAALGYSPAYLTHRVKLETGTPVTAWIIRRRLQEAAELLVATEDSISDICYSVGFNDVCYFSRQFVRYAGMTASRYRLTQRDARCPTSRSADRSIAS